MNVKKRAERDFKQLNDWIEDTANGLKAGFDWRYGDITIRYKNDVIRVFLPPRAQFIRLSLGEVDLVLRSLLKIYAGVDIGLIEKVTVNWWSDYKLQANEINAHLAWWREYNETTNFNNPLDNEDLNAMTLDSIIRWLIICIKHVIYTEGEYWTRKTMEENSSMEVDNISEFYDRWFAAHQEYVNDGLGYEVKLVKNDIEYLNINAFRVPEQGLKHIRVMLRNPLDFNVTPDEFNKLLFMLSVIYSWEDSDLGRYVHEYYTPLIKFLKKSRRDLLREDYRQLFDSYYDDIKVIDDDDWAHDDKARWLKALTEAWSMLTDQLAEQVEEAEDDNEMKDLSTDNVRIFNNVGDFCAAFYSEELTFVSNAENFKIMLFSKDKHTKYISIAGYNGSQVNVTFHESTFVIELTEVMNVVRVMRRLMLASYNTGEYGVDFNYKSYPDDMLSYIKFLLGNTPEKYKECYDKFEELEQEEDKYLYELYERAYTFLGKWLDYAENWQERHDSDSNSDNYYADDNGQDMFAKFESLDDFREQTYALGFCYHNIEKYLVRAGRKTTDPTEDINKALDYLHEYRKLQKIYFE